MARRNSPGQSTLFEAIELEDDRAKPKEDCPHRYEDETDTNWGPPYGVRMTATCRACGRIRGRVGSLAFEERSRKRA